MSSESWDEARELLAPDEYGTTNFSALAVWFFRHGGSLLDIAEAAQECWRVIPPNGNDRFQMAAHDRLRDALLRAAENQAGAEQ